jgi:hypothetical protein
MLASIAKGGEAVQGYIQQPVQQHITPSQGLPPARPCCRRDGDGGRHHRHRGRRDETPAVAGDAAGHVGHHPGLHLHRPDRGLPGRLRPSPRDRLGLQRLCRLKQPATQNSNRSTLCVGIDPLRGLPSFRGVPPRPSEGEAEGCGGWGLTANPSGSGVFAMWYHTTCVEAPAFAWRLAILVEPVKTKACPAISLGLALSSRNS